ncbi:MAG: FHA domain-containing protein [Cocleimonas sp.]|nr:FHA domain-containing protein [Cocleimonas sp.]
MGKVILETIQRGVHRYHKIDSFPVTIGRAFDNDIILQDVTISPHHLVILNENDTYQIHNLNDENGTKVNKKKIGNEPVEISLPTTFQISGLKARLLATNMKVEETRVQDCSGLFCIFNSPIWAALLLVVTVALFFVDRYLSTPVVKEPLWYLSNVLPSVWVMLGIGILIASISRLSTHRWEVIPAISIASLIFLVPQVFEYIGHFLAYLFTSDGLGSWLKNSAKFLIIPILLATFIVKTVHSKWLPAIGIAVLAYSPFLAYQVLGLVDELSLLSGFSKVPSYSHTLRPRDIRLNKTISLEEFAKEAKEATAIRVEKMLKDARKKEEEDS